LPFKIHKHSIGNAIGLKNAGEDLPSLSPVLKQLNWREVACILFKERDALITNKLTD